MVHPAPAERVPEVRPAHHLVSHHTAELAQAVRYHHILLYFYMYSWYILSYFSRGQGGILRRGRSTRWPRGRGKLRRRSGGWCGSGQVVHFYQLYFFSAIILLVSVCVLLGVLVLGVLRLRASHNRQLREEQEVEMVSRELINYQNGGV